MHGKMQALEALLEMLSKMDLDKMSPKKDVPVSVEMEVGAEKEAPSENPLHEALETPEMEAKEEASGEEAMEDEEELKKLYSSLK